MRLKYAKLITIIVFIVNMILLYYTWKWFLVGESEPNPTVVNSFATNEKAKQKERIQSANKHIKKTITIIFRDFYHFENDLQHSIDCILNLIPNVQILVVYDDEPYPPLSFISNYTSTRTNVKFINLNFDIRKTAKALSPIYQIRTKYVLFVPDSFRFGGRAIIQKMIKEIETETTPQQQPQQQRKAIKTTQTPFSASDGDANVQNPNSDNNLSIDKNKNSKSTIKRILIVPFASNVKTMGNCCRIELDFANWSMEYSVKNDSTDCDMVNYLFFILHFVIILFDSSIIFRLFCSFYKSTPSLSTLIY